jgi:chemotaxis protein MotB
MADKQENIIIKRIKKGGHGHHGGAWKVAYADFVTAMMCFFLVMWLMGSDDETKAAISHYFNHPNTPWKSGGDPNSDEVHPMGEKDGSGDSVMNGLNGLYPEDLISERPLRNLKALFAENQALSQVIEDALAGNAYAMDVSYRAVQFSMPESVLFKPGSSDLTFESKKYLDKLATVIKQFDGVVTIDGHTDDKPPKSGKYRNNWELSLARAVSVMDYLIVQHKVAESKLQPTASGPRRGIASNDEADGRQKNRRVEFTLSRKKPVAQ